MNIVLRIMSFHQGNFRKAESRLGYECNPTLNIRNRLLVIVKWKKL